MDWDSAVGVGRPSGLGVLDATGPGAGAEAVGSPPGGPEQADRPAIIRKRPDRIKKFMDSAGPEKIRGGMGKAI